jgi:hypothetical protein
MINYNLKLSRLLKNNLKKEKQKANKEFVKLLEETIEEYIKIESRPWKRKRIVFKNWETRNLVDFIKEELSKLFPETTFVRNTQEYSLSPDCPCIDWKPSEEAVK